MKVKKLNMAKWIVALRTTKVAQTKWALRDAVGYCCLGVVCTISKLGKWEPTVSGSAFNFVVGKGKKQTVISNILPAQVVKWLGLEEHETNPAIEGDGLTSVTASKGNDIQNLTFSQIADKLEARYLPGEKAEDIVRKAKARAKKRLSAAK